MSQWSHICTKCSWMKIVVSIAASILFLHCSPHCTVCTTYSNLQLICVCRGKPFRTIYLVVIFSLSFWAFLPLMGSQKLRRRNVWGKVDFEQMRQLPADRLKKCTDSAHLSEFSPLCYRHWLRCNSLHIVSTSSSNLISRTDYFKWKMEAAVA